MSIEKDWKTSLKLTPHGDLFADIVQELRNAILLDGLTQHEIAAKCGVSIGTINNWMNFVVFSPQFRTVAGVCRGLGLNLRIDRKNRTIKKVA